MTNKEEINKLLIKENELYHEQQKYSDKLSSVKIEIQKIKTKIQSLCEHEWITEKQPYQKEVYCKKCLLFDWSKCRYY